MRLAAFLGWSFSAAFVERWLQAEAVPRRAENAAIAHSCLPAMPRRSKQSD